MGDKFPVNKPYKGKYSGSAGRSYSSSRAQMNRGAGGGGKPPSKEKGCLKAIFGAFLTVVLTGAVLVAVVLDSIYRL